MRRRAHSRPTCVRRSSAALRSRACLSDQQGCRHGLRLTESDRPPTRAEPCRLHLRRSATICRCAVDRSRASLTFGTCKQSHGRGMDRLTEMEAFVRVVDHGGFTEAARKDGPVEIGGLQTCLPALEARLTRPPAEPHPGASARPRSASPNTTRARTVLTDAAGPTAWSPRCRRRPGACSISVPVSFGISRGLARDRALPAIYAEVDIHMVLGPVRRLVAEGYDAKASRVGVLETDSLRVRKLAETTRPRRLTRLSRAHGPAARRIDDLHRHRLPYPPRHRQFLAPPRGPSGEA